MIGTYYGWERWSIVFDLLLGYAIIVYQTNWMIWDVYSPILVDEVTLIYKSERSLPWSLTVKHNCSTSTSSSSRSKNLCRGADRLYIWYLKCHLYRMNLLKNLEFRRVRGILSAGSENLWYLFPLQHTQQTSSTHKTFHAPMGKLVVLWLCYGDQAESKKQRSTWRSWCDSNLG